MFEEINEVIEAYSTISNVEGVLLYGSRATFIGDRYSDYDLYIILSNDPPKIQCRKILEMIKGVTSLQFESISKIQIWNDEWMLRGESFIFNDLKIDTGYQSISWIKKVINGVVVEGKTSLDEIGFRPYTIMGLLENSQLLYDKNGEISRLKQTTRPYPSVLKDKLISEGIAIIDDSLEDLSDYCQRGIGNTAFLFQLGRITDALCQIAFAVNEEYDPASKRVEAFLEELALKPKDFMQKYKEMMLGPFDEEGRKRTVGIIRDIYKEFLNLANTQ